jgi:acetyltransferase-like isoleucine patch superfamily enzyme
MLNNKRKPFTIHPSSECDSAHVGEGTHIWRYSYIASSARIGQDCMIGQGCYVEGTLGNRVRVQNNCCIYNTTVIEDDVFIGPGVLTLNDKHPPSNSLEYKPITIQRYAYIGGGATILPGVTVCRGARVGAGAVVTRDVPPDTVVTGNPARRLHGASSRPIR